MAKSTGRKSPAGGDGHRKVRYAVVGLGHIAQVAALPAFEHAKKSSVLAALVSDDEAKLKKLARKYQVEHTFTYETYEECLESGAVDAVFIATPNSLHRDFAIPAARAGVHVLCEKPLEATESACQEILDACEAAGVKLMTAYRLHFERANLGAAELARSGKLGEVRLFNSTFTMQVEDEDNIRLKRHLGGGPLLDIGIYCVNASRYLFRDEPVEVMALTARGDDPRFEEVEELAGAVLRFPGERLATFAVSFNASEISSFRIVGTKGDLRVEPAYSYAKDLVHHLTIGGRTREKVYPRRDQFAAELVYFSECVLEDRQPEPSGREGLIDVAIVQAIFRSAEKREAVSLELPEKVVRPTLRQEKRLPPVRPEPKTVRTSSPKAGS